MRIDKYVFKGYPKTGEERRFLISFENLDIIKRLSGYEVALVTDCQETGTIRTRKIEIDGREHYFRTMKEEEDVFSKTEEAITKDAFEKSVENIYHLYRVITRTRYSFADGIVSSAILAKLPLESEEGRGMYMMLDTFSTWNGFGILIVKGNDVKNIDNLKLPGLTIVKDITEDKTYCTKSIATIDYTSFLE